MAHPQVIAVGVRQDQRNEDHSCRVLAHLEEVFVPQLDRQVSVLPPVAGPEMTHSLRAHRPLTGSYDLYRPALEASEQVRSPESMKKLCAYGSQESGRVVMARLEERSGSQTLEQ